MIQSGVITPDEKGAGRKPALYPEPRSPNAATSEASPLHSAVRTRACLAAEAVNSILNM